MQNMTVTFLDGREPVTFEGVIYFDATNTLSLLVEARKMPPEYGDNHKAIVHNWKSFTVTNSRHDGVA